VAARSSGPKVLVTRVGQPSLPFSVTSTIVDVEHVIKSVRRCFYDPETQEPVNCFSDAIDRIAGRTSTGWTLSRKLNFNAVSASECRYYSRERPELEYQLSFLDQNDDEVGTSAISFRLTCQR
jgi:hypothetical protein